MNKIIWDKDYDGLRSSEISDGPHAEMKAITSCPDPTNIRDAAEYVKAAAIGCKGNGSGIYHSPALVKAVKFFGGSCRFGGVFFMCSGGGSNVRGWDIENENIPTFWNKSKEVY